MNQLSTQTIRTMSSREIAELTGKEHRNVLRDIRNQLGQIHGEEGLLRFERTYIDGSNREAREYLLPRVECMTVTSGYNVRLRHAIISRWEELEEQSRQVPQMTSMQMIHAIAGSMVEVERRQEEHQIALENIEHRMNSRANQVGYLLWTDAKRRYCPTLSRDTIFDMVNLKQVTNYLQWLITNGFETQVMAVHEEEFRIAAEEFLSEVVQVTPTLYTHPQMGSKRFRV